MDTSYKDIPPPPINILLTQIIDDRSQSNLNQFKTMLQNRLQELVYLNSQNDEKSIQQYIEKCYIFGLLFIGSMPKEIFTLLEFSDFIDFICMALSQSTNTETIICNLTLIITIISRHYSSVKEFESREIVPVLFQLAQSNIDPIIDKSIKCVSYLIKGTDNLSIYEPFMNKPLLHDLSSRSPEIRSSVLSFCSSVLNQCHHYYLFRDILIQIGIELFEFSDGNDIDFLSSLRRLLKICPTPIDIFNLFQSTETDSFLYSISEMINPEFYTSASLQVLKLFYSMVKYVKESIPVILSCITNFQDEIIKICHEKQDDPPIISISYKILSHIIPLNCNIIKKLLYFDQEEVIFIPIILNNLAEGNFPLRKASIKLTLSMMKWGTIFEETNFFYSYEFIEVISSILLSDSKILIQSSLNSLEMIANKAVNENIIDLINIFHDQILQEPFEYLDNKYKNDEDISIPLYHILKTLQIIN